MTRKEIALPCIYAMTPKPITQKKWKAKCGVRDAKTAVRFNMLLETATFCSQLGTTQGLGNRQCSASVSVADPSNRKPCRDRVEALKMRNAHADKNSSKYTRTEQIDSPWCWSTVYQMLRVMNCANPTCKKDKNEVSINPNSYLQWETRHMKAPVSTEKATR